jgi:hypothetical protein
MKVTARIAEVSMLWTSGVLWGWRRHWLIAECQVGRRRSWASGKKQRTHSRSTPETFVVLNLRTLRASAWLAGGCVWGNCTRSFVNYQRKNNLFFGWSQEWEKPDICRTIKVRTSHHIGLLYFGTRLCLACCRFEPEKSLSVCYSVWLVFRLVPVCCWQNCDRATKCRRPLFFYFEVSLILAVIGVGSAFFFSAAI